MAYIGNIPATQFASLDYQDLTGVTGSPSKRGFTLDNTVGSANDIEVFVNNVRQEPGVAYTVSGTTLTMTGDVETTDDFYVVFQGKSIGTASHPAGNALEATTGTFTGALTATDGTFSGGLTATAGASTNALSLQSSNFKMTDLTTNAFYRTGTFTPFLGSSGSSPQYTQEIITSGSYVHRYGHYTRIGDMVFAYVDMKFDYSGWTYQNGGSNTDNISIAGFPFKTADLTNYYPPSQHAHYLLDVAMGWTSYNVVGIPPSTNLDYVRIAYPSAGGTGSFLLASHLYYQASGSNYDSRIVFNWNYRTDEA